MPEGWSHATLSATVADVGLETREVRVPTPADPGDRAGDAALGHRARHRSRRRCPARRSRSSHGPVPTDQAAPGGYAGYTNRKAHRGRTSSGTWAANSMTGSPSALVTGTKSARRQLGIIAVVSVLLLAFLAACALRSLVGMTVFAILGGLALGMIDPVPGAGLERHLSQRPIRSPLDWRVRQLGRVVGINVEPWIWTRRLLLTIMIAWLIVSGGIP